jgi:hypothetical protein
MVIAAAPSQTCLSVQIAGKREWKERERRRVD